MKKIYTIIVLIFNVLIRRKKYELHFVAENDPPIKRWYYDFPHWGFNHGHLEMVAGADRLCELYANGKDEVTVNIIATNKKAKQYNKNEVDEFIAEEQQKGTKFIDKLIYGRTYTSVNENGNLITMWICPVTLFVLGRYPKYIYIKK